ncbi:MAG TPA: hypothetical protein VMT60_04345 [Candidatus Bathyarchaeia archaeon]|nr:hypothetical protein [Candidatus Bathyarchaeia archaeon]
MRAPVRGMIALAVVGTLVSAQQAHAESVFTVTGARSVGSPELQHLVLARGAAPSCGTRALDFASFRADTVETVDVEVEGHKGPSMAKQLAIFGIVTAAVAYAVIVLMKSDDGSSKTQTPGKTVPPTSALAGFAVPLSRLR